MFGRLLLALVLANAACLRSTEYRCASNAECDVGGTCQPDGYCSVLDPACPSGSRYSDTAGPNANQCVGGTPGDVDASTDGNSNSSCPPGYATLPNGQADHKYLLRTQGREWTQHLDACAADSSKTYLAIPDDATELAAITSLSSQRVWVGISDRATEATFLTIKGTPATFLPWEPSAPGGDDRDDCVEAIRATPDLINDERCDRDRPAVCECEP